MPNKINIEDKSGDKKYFTIIPNYIANHSTAVDQALYLQMKKIVGEQEGICYASEKYFKQKLGVGSKALKKSIKYLLDHNWIEDAGIKEIETKGGVQKTRLYIVKDIWTMNINYYKGVSESEPLIDKGVSESNQRGVQKEAKGVAFEQQIRTINKNINNNISTIVEIQTQASGGDQQINQIIDFLKNTLGGTPDGTIKQNRRFAKLLLDKIKKDYPDKDPIIQIQALITFGLKDKFHGKNITSFKYLYYNCQKIIQSIKFNNKPKIKII